ncbi:MAG: hypothetical protein O7E49_06405 [Gemmatimonadetes bacterium]|nr:hypothetical protein [Gemmatimonadota bacterium]
MGISAVAVLALSLQATGQLPDSTYANQATRHLILRAQARHRAQDSAVTDYRARLRYRISFSLGRRRWARMPVAAVEEQEAIVQWQLPNDVRVDIVGRRSKARKEDWRINSVMDHPWFFPRNVGDSVSFFGSEFPERAALHPLASDGPVWYRYAVTDSVRLFLPSGQELRILKVEVVPKGEGLALIVGNMWLDAATAQVVRLTFRFVGTGLWDVADDDDGDFATGKANQIINRILSVDADIEYSLQDGEHWMPYRQVLAGRVRIPIVTDIVIPFEATATFDEYEINTGRRIVFTVPDPDSAKARQALKDRREKIRAARRQGERYYDDSTRTVDYTGYWAGGRYQVHRPPVDSLERYAGWTDSLTLDPDPQDDERMRQAEAEVARLAETLSGAMTGVPSRGIAYERFADILRFNRVQGLSAGLGYQVKVPWMSFTDALGTIRFGIADTRVNGKLSLIRDAPGGRVTVGAYREVAEVDRFFRIGTLGNSVNAAFTSHDYADYYLATGASVGFETSITRDLQLALFARVEDQQSVIREVGSGLNGLWSDNQFQGNPPVSEGTFGVVGWRLDGTAGMASWRVATDAFMGSALAVGRLYGSWRQPLPDATRLTLALEGGVSTSDDIAQAQFRLGGQQSVRGFPYGFKRGQAFWAFRADWAPWRGTVRPVLFIDSGQAGSVSSLGNEPLLVGGGIGASFFNGLVRFDLSGPFAGGEGQGVRFDIVFGALR